MTRVPEPTKPPLHGFEIHIVCNSGLADFIDQISGPASHSTVMSQLMDKKQCGITENLVWELVGNTEQDALKQIRELTGADNGLSCIVTTRNGDIYEFKNGERVLAFEPTKRVTPD